MALRSKIEGVAGNAISLFNNERHSISFIITENGVTSFVPVGPLSEATVDVAGFAANAISIETGPFDILATKKEGDANFTYLPSNTPVLAVELEKARQFVQRHLSPPVRASMMTWMTRKLAELFVLNAKGQASLSTEALTAAGPDMAKMKALDDWEQACLDAAKIGEALPLPPDFLEAYALEF